MDKHPSNPASKPDRKTVEKNRRNEMKNLFTQLNSLLPPHLASSSSIRQEAAMSLPDQIDEATRYIKKLQAHLERLKEKKRNMGLGGGNSCRLQRSMGSPESVASFKPPQIEVYATGNSSALEVVLITGLDCQFFFTEAIRVLHDEGVEVVNASFSTSDDVHVFHTIHGKIEECPQSQEAIARITQRLKSLSFDP